MTLKLGFGIASAVVLLSAAVAGGASRSPGQHDPGATLRWSPNGMLLTFTRGGRTLVMRADGSRQRLFPAGGGSWSPDGRHLAFGRAGTIYVAQADGSNPRRLAKGESASWAPGSDMLVIANVSLSIIRADGTGLRRLTTPPPCNSPCHGRYHSEPAWSPDGKWIAYAEATNTDGIHGFANIHVVNPDGTDERAIETDAYFATNPTWSPDGRWLLYTDDFENRGDPSIFIARAETNFSIRRLGAGSSGIWAPTSRAVAYKPEGAHDLYVSRPEGGTTRIRAASNPSWSPDGKRLAFQRGLSVVVSRPDGTGARAIAKGSAPSFSTKGVIAYASIGCGAGQGIHVVLPTGRGDRRVTTACTITGDHGNDTINGGLERQSVLAGHGNDLVHGDGGNDVLDGGPGDDVVHGDGGHDILVGGAGVDRLLGGAGPDVIRARDSWRDAITCGPGQDTVEADTIDLVAADCELIRRG
jgi:hypothetical protein